MDRKTLVERAYRGFNARDVDGVLATLHPDVEWPNGWEGGWVHGHAGVRAYWTRQWEVLDPHVEPVSIEETDDGLVKVVVHSVVRDRQGALVMDGYVHHHYSFDGDLIRRMEIVETAAGESK